jgi:hypothetical protein
MNTSRLSPKASRAWKSFAAEAGCSLSAMGEALGLLLHRAAEEGEAAVDLNELGTLARQLSAERRER